MLVDSASDIFFKPTAATTGSRIAFGNLIWVAHDRSAGFRTATHGVSHRLECTGGGLCEQPVVIGGQAFTTGKIKRNSIEKVLPNTLAEFKLKDGAGCNASHCSSGAILPSISAGRHSAAQMMNNLMDGRGPIGGPFTPVDQTGKLRSDREFRGKLMIIYFGYTHCPDVCPADLQATTLALDQLGTSAANVQSIFITIDPERDNNVLAEYVSPFHSSLIGLKTSIGASDVIRQSHCPNAASFIHLILFRPEV